MTVDYGSITSLGLQKVEWGGVETDSYSAYSGSVVVRFDRDFIGSQPAGNHTVRVEFLNHYGETTVAVGTGASSESTGFIGNGGTHNPSTGGSGMQHPLAGNFTASPWTCLAALIPAAALRKRRLGGHAGK